MKNEMWNKLTYISIPLLIAILLRIDAIEPLDFDSSYNLLLSKNLALYGKYASNNYLLSPDKKFFYFDTWITTGPPLLLPTALLFKLTGVNFLYARFMMNLLLLIFVMMVVHLINHSLSKKIKIKNLRLS